MIFCVEDDNSIRDLIIYTLSTAGFEARGFADGQSFWKAVKEKTPSLVLLDIMLPGEDGLSILKKLRTGTKTKKIPIIMTTAKGTEYDKVIGLDLGADDYLAKPFGMMEMISRVKALLRRTSLSDNNEILRIGDLELDTGRHTVVVCGEETELTLKEFDLLRFFMESVGKAFNRDELLKEIWSSEYSGETRTVDVHIGTLRTKLKSCGDYIKTVRGVGYKMEEVK